MKKFLTGWAFTLAGPLILIFLGLGSVAAFTGAIGSQSVQSVSVYADVPPELKPLLEEVEERWEADWHYLAAYVKETHNWRLPIRTRLQWLDDREEYNRKLREHPCHPEHLPEEERLPPEDPACADYEVPPDKSTSRGTIERLWREDARDWLEFLVWEIYGVTSEYEWRNRPVRSFREAMRNYVSYPSWKAIKDRAMVYEAWYSLRDSRQADELGEAVHWEDGSLLLSLLDWEYAFPVKGGPWSFSDTWGDDRPQNDGYASTRHHGTDIMAPRGTPVVAVDRCIVFRKGWNYLGGWTLTLQCSDGYFHYYAHLERYADGLSEGKHVQRGQIIAYVGDSGEGPPGTTGRMEPHLHYAIYLAPDRWVTNPFRYLLHWQAQGGN